MKSVAGIPRRGFTAGEMFVHSENEKPAGIAVETLQEATPEEQSEPSTLPIGGESI